MSTNEINSHHGYIQLSQLVNRKGIAQKLTWGFGFLTITVDHVALSRVNHELASIQKTLERLEQDIKIRSYQNWNNSYFWDGSILFHQQRGVVIDRYVIRFVMTKAAEETVENATTAGFLRWGCSMWRGTWETRSNHITPTATLLFTVIYLCIHDTLGYFRQLTLVMRWLYSYACINDR